MNLGLRLSISGAQAVGTPSVRLNLSASTIEEGLAQGAAVLTFTPQNASNPSGVSLSNITPASAVQMDLDGVTLEAGSYTLFFATDLAVTFTATFSDDNGTYNVPVNLTVVQNGVPAGGPITLTFDVDADETASMLSLPVGTKTGTTTADGGVTISEGNGTVYMVTTTSATTPSGPQVIAGTDESDSAATFDDSLAVSSTGAKTFSITGLTANTTYYNHYTQEDAAGNISTPVSSASFTTDASASLAISSQGQLINSSTPGTSFTSDSTITLSAGDMLVIEYGTMRNTGLSAMNPTMTWNGESITEQVQILHSGGRATAHVLSLVAASSATASVSISLSNSAAAQSGRYYIVTGQSGTPVKQTASDSVLSGTGGPCSLNFASAVNTGALIFGCGMARFSTGGVTSLTADSPYTQDANIQTNVTPSSNLDGVFAAGHFTTVSTTAPSTTFTPDVNCNICTAGIEVF